MRSDACASWKTCTGRPFVGRLGASGGLFVATGGCGLAAKSSDEIGRLGALAALSPTGWAEGEDESALPRAEFEPKLRAACGVSVVARRL